jgi:hypothetical protein
MVVIAARLPPVLERLCGSVPATLELEDARLAFANEVGFKLPDAGLEPHLVLASQRYPSRAWVRAEHVKFYA